MSAVRRSLVLALAAVAALPAAARAEDAAQCYDLAATVLTASSGADLTLGVTAREGCAAVDELKKVQIKKYDLEGKLVDVENMTDVALAEGEATHAIGELVRSARVEADVLIDDGHRTWVARTEAIARLRPDLVVASITAPAQTLAVRPIDVTAEIAEMNEDVSATATVTLSWGPSVIATSEVDVPAGGSVPVAFRGVALTAPTAVELAVRISDVSPAETDATNNDRTTTVDVTEFELARSRLVLDNLGGYGSQFNQHVFGPFTNPPPDTLAEFEEKVKALEPQFVRIMYHVGWETDPRWSPGNMESFVDTVRLAHEAGATINITYHSAAAPVKFQPDLYMGRFADILKQLVDELGYTSVRWVTIQNEPNSTDLTLAQYEALNRAIDAHLRSRGLRDRIGIMAGDLVESTGSRRHDVWFRYIVDNMNDITDAYSEHIYWNYWDIPRMEFRLRDVAKLMIQDVPANARKPVYITEFAVRGLRNLPGKTEPPGYWPDGTQITRTNISAFQQLWFNIVAAQLGFAGTSKWDTYWGVYDVNRFGNPSPQSHWMIGPASEGWPLFPTYHAFRLLLQTTERGWHVLGVDPWADDDWNVDSNDQAEKELAAYESPDGAQLTVFGLDTHARELNTASPDTATYSVGGFAPGSTFTLVVWNATGSGENAAAGSYTANAAGVVRFDVPLHAAFALTTVPVAMS